MDILFIGGANDGKHVDLTNIGEPWRMFVKPHSAFARGDAIETETYRPMSLRGDSEIFVVYVLDGLKADHVMRALIENYKK